MRASQDVSNALKRRYTCCFGAQMTVAQAVSVVSAANRGQLTGASPGSVPSATLPLVHHQYTMTILADSKSTATPVREGQSTALLAAWRWDVSAHSTRGDLVISASEIRSLSAIPFIGTSFSHRGLMGFTNVTR